MRWHNSKKTSFQRDPSLGTPLDPPEGVSGVKNCSKFAKFAYWLSGGAESCRCYLKQGFSTLGPPIRGSKNGFFEAQTPPGGGPRGQKSELVLRNPA